MQYYPVFLQWSLSHSCNKSIYNHCLYTVRTALNFAVGSFCCKITLVWLDSSLSVDGFLNKLKNSGVGCSMGIKFMGGVSFADDIKLLTPTHKGLNKRIYICEQYAVEFDIKFNGAKSKHIVYKGRNCVVHRMFL